MSSNEIDLIERLHAVAQGFEMPAAPLADDLRRGRRRARRKRGTLAVAVALAVVLGVTAAFVRPPRGGPDGLVPVDWPGIGLGDVPVWYDAKGLHRGDVVEQTPVKIWQLEPPQPNQGVTRGALALVRSGAVYLDPATFDVWFHPWGGEPRIVGRNSAAGPGGDPNGDTAAWFDGSELVVYDTAAGREISRTQEGRAAGASRGFSEHYPTGNGFLQVSAEHIRWKNGDDGWYSHDVRKGSTSEVPNPEGRHLLDVHDDVKVFGYGALFVRVPGEVERRFPDLVARARLSSSGNYALAPEYTDARFGPAIVDTRTGELWRTPNDGYLWIAWSYGDVALVDTESALLACDAARRACETLDAERPFLLPTS